MKHKLSSIWRITIALVMVLSFSLVTAAPVNANVSPATVTLSDYTAEATAVVYTIEFEVGVALAVGNQITVTFPVGTTVPTGIIPADITVEDTDDSATSVLSDVSVVGQVVTMTTDSGTGNIEAGHTVEVVFLSAAGIVNPADGGDYYLDVRTTFETTDIPSAAYTITIVPASFEVIVGTAGTVLAGEAFSVVITALESGGATETTYTGDRFIDFSWEGGPSGATIPSFELITFTNGVGTSPASFIMEQVQTGKAITATATAPTVTGTSDAITINPAALDSLNITFGDSTLTAGDAFTSDVTVTAEDAYNNTKTDYTGTVTWTSTDPTATAGAGLPADYTFVSGDEGVKAFAAADFILKKVLDEATTITVIDGTVAFEIITITVTAASATALEVVSDVALIRADGSDTATITVNAVDPYGNLDLTDSGTVVTVTSSLGTINTPGSTLSSGTSSAASLDSSDVGTATIRVVDNSGTLPYATTTVSIVAATAVTEVWVDGSYVDADDDGGHDFGINAFKKIDEGIAAVATGGTVNVAAGTYTLDSGEELIIGKQLTLKGANYGINAVTGDRGAESVIDGTAIGAGNLATVSITAANVIVDGFVIVGPTDGGSYAVLLEGSSTAPAGEVRNNIIYTTGGGFGIMAQDTVHTSWVISNNRVAATGSTAVYLAGGEGTQITGNLITDGGITVTSGGGGDIATNTTIENNTISNGTGSSGVTLANDAEDVTITGNTFSGNGAYGINILSGATKVSTYAIQQNNFAAKTTDGVLNDTLTPVDATNNWWGDDTGPLHFSNPDGIGATISDLVVYTPYLGAAYTAPGASVTTYSITLTEGWNLISLPLIPDVPAIETVLADLIAGVTVEKVWNYTAATTTWSSYAPAAPDDLVTMVDGKGYWVEMSAAATLTIQGDELPAPPLTPPTYDVVVGWNFIGFKSTTAKTANTYLAAIAGQYTIIYAFDAASQAYVTVLPSDNFEPGKGYWVAITATGTIYP